MDAITGWMQKRQSRRGFLAMCGKASLALGLAMAGASKLALVAYAQCCAVPACANCPSIPPNLCGSTTNGCPAGCSQAGGPVLCCDTTGTNTCHGCYPCVCDGPCTCECDTQLDCAGRC